jgi:hypothetical protein
MRKSTFLAFLLVAAGVIVVTRYALPKEHFEDDDDDQDISEGGADGNVPMLVKLMVPRDMANQASGVAPPPVYVKPLTPNEMANEGVELAVQGIRDAVAEALAPKPWPWTEQLAIEDASPLLPKEGGIVAWASGEAVKSRRLSPPGEIDATTPPFVGMMSKNLLPKLPTVPLDPDAVMRPDPEGVDDRDAPQSDLWKPESFGPFDRNDADADA